MRTAAAIGGVLLCTCGLAQDSATAEHVMLTEPGFHVARARASQDASEVYDAVNRARAAIRNSDTATVSAQIARGLAAARRLNAQGHSRDAVPIYAELAEQFSKGPLGAQPRLSSEADRLRFGATDQAVTPITAPPQYTTMSLNMAGVEAHLQDADAALSDRQLKGADAALAAVQNAVTMQVVAADLPLLHARQNLNLAEEQARQRAYQVVRSTLDTAARQLHEYGAPGAVRLADEISAYAASIVDRHDDANARIEDWWDRAARLSER